MRTRLLLWLLAAVFPIFSAGLIMVSQVENRVSTTVERDLGNLLRLEAARIESALISQEIDAAAIAARTTVAEAIEAAVGAPRVSVGSPLDDLANDLARDHATSAQRNLEDVRIVNRQGSVLGQSKGFSWQPTDPTLIERAMEERRTLFGNAFSVGVGGERIGLVVPVVTAEGSVVGALVFEDRLGPIVELISEHEGFGETSEAFLVQETTGGGVELITLRRFQRDAAFQAAVPSDQNSPSAKSLSALEPQVVSLDDYRGEETVAAIQRIDPPGWGLVVKIDASEANALSRTLTRSIVFASSLSALVLVLGWIMQVRPLGRRLKRTADASERVADGDYRSLIGDTSTDEIGELARGIDRLASDLEADITARELAEERLRFQANHDTLTGLINRQRAGAVIDELAADDLFSLLFLDLDGFKEINDTYGHAVGDQVLVAVAGRLSTALNGIASVARWGGDEFLAVLIDVDESEAAEISDRISLCFNESFASRVGDHTIGASIGGATSGKGRTPSQVLADADAAMFRAKRNRAAYRKISPVAIRIVESALSEGRVEVAFQPVVHLDEFDRLSLDGAEALVRIRTLEGSVLTPAEFLPALGANELSAALDSRVAELAFAEVGSWHRRNTVPDHFSIALNVGPASMSDPLLPSRIAALMKRFEIRPSWVLIEIPETVEVVRPETVASLRSLGVRLAIDDVGVQYSNLERMVDINADIAKLDRRWIPDLATAENSTSEVLRGLIGQCRTLGLDIIAEGVETEEQLRMLRNLGVEVFQGYFFGRPVSAFDFERMWSRSSTELVQALPTGH